MLLVYFLVGCLTAVVTTIIMSLLFIGITVIADLTGFNVFEIIFVFIALTGMGWLVVELINLFLK